MAADRAPAGKVRNVAAVSPLPAYATPHINAINPLVSIRFMVPPKIYSLPLNHYLEHLLPTVAFGHHNVNPAGHRVAPVRFHVPDKRVGIG
jgi:hypothetical protein